jgi:hypothetical protein
MTQEDIIRMAREAGFQSAEYWPDDFKGLMGCVERFAALVASAEREACALVCINIANKPSNVILGVAINCADAIRARGRDA